MKLRYTFANPKSGPMRTIVTVMNMSVKPGGRFALKQDAQLALEEFGHAFLSDARHVSKVGMPRGSKASVQELVVGIALDVQGLDTFVQRLQKRIHPTLVLAERNITSWPKASKRSRMPCSKSLGLRSPSGSTSKSTLLNNTMVGLLSLPLPMSVSVRSTTDMWSSNWGG